MHQLVNINIYIKMHGATIKILKVMKKKVPKKVFFPLIIFMIKHYFEGHILGILRERVSYRLESSASSGRQLSNERTVTATSVRDVQI